MGVQDRVVVLTSVMEPELMACGLSGVTCVAGLASVPRLDPDSVVDCL